VDGVRQDARYLIDRVLERAVDERHRPPRSVSFGAARAYSRRLVTGKVAAAPSAA
jgi:hypothetical protein